ncbi:MAG: LuxR family transcriptional regulator [Anaerolineae bacterium SG8_19]|jgi:NarL family two-component system response regulator LiaR|nr:MAG: LuxR family transcriptional regulator [Anaerolineae bacterium SG8_19]HCB49146.1 DNA-binding response regulator [Chloroflexota bacterium]
MNDEIRVFLADDHAVVRAGIEALIGTEKGMTVVGTAADGEEAVARVADLNPDVILLDIQMPKKNGIEAIAEIKERDPRARILVLTSFSDEDKVFAAIKAGAVGYILKDASPHQLLRAIHYIHEGKSSLDPEIALKVIHELNKPSELPPTEEPLTEREVEILQLVARGLSNQQISEELIISERTARTHISNILAKLHLANRTQAALYALRQGIASLDEE